MYRLPSLIVLLILLTCASRLPADAPANPGGLKLVFPDVDGWTHAQPEALPPEHGGYMVDYELARPHATATLYVLDRGLPHIENNLTSEPIRTEFAAAKKSIQQAAQMGLYKNLKEEQSGESTLGQMKSAPKCLYARYAMTVEDQPVTSELYVLPYRNHFIKFRITRVPGADEALTRLHAAFAKMLAN